MKRIIYVGAEWCGQCKVLRPMFIRELQRLEVNLSVRFLDADDDTAQAVIRKFNIRNIPTIIVLDADGNEAGRAFGVNAWKEMEGLLNG